MKTVSKTPKRQQAMQMTARAALFAFAALACASPALADGLDGAKSTLEGVLADVKVIVPILATLGLIGCGVAYAFRWVELKQIVTFAIGCIIVGAAGAFVPVLMTGI